MTPSPVANIRASDSQSASEKANRTSAAPATDAPNAIVVADRSSEGRRVARTVHEEAHPLARAGDDGAPDRRPDQPRRVRDRRVQRDRVPDVLTALDHVGHEGLAGRDVQSADDP